MTLTAAVFAVIVAGWQGVAILAAIILLLLLAELWAEDARHAARAVKAASRIAELETSLGDAQEGASKVESAQIEAATLRIDLADAQDQIEELQAELASPTVGFERLIELLAGQIQFIDLVQKHRSLQQEGLDEWPVVRISLHDDDSVLVEAYAGEHSERLADEWITLVIGDEEGETTRVATAGDREVFALFDTDHLPGNLIEKLTQTGSFAPNGVRLRLAGLNFPPFTTVTDDDLSELRTALLAVAESLAKALRAPSQLRLTEAYDEEGTA